MSKIEWTDVTWNPITGCTPFLPDLDLDGIDWVIVGGESGVQPAGSMLDGREWKQFPEVK